MHGEQTRQEARACALRLLARREHSQHEMALKLQQRGYEPPVAEAIVAELAREDWVSDARYAAALVLGRRKRGYGPLRIRAELRHHGVEEELAESHLACSEAEWIQLAQRLCAERFGESPRLSRRERERRARFLLNRGFTRGQARKVVEPTGGVGTCPDTVD